MSDLKPCPFCDCEMEIESVGRDWWRIKPVDDHEDTCPFGEQHEWDCSQQKPEWKDEHIADWNKRADDRLVEENKQQRESLDAFRDLVKLQTRTIGELNEECSELEDKTLKLTTVLYQLRDFLSDIEYDLDQADSRFTLKDEIGLIDETLTIGHKE